MRRRGFTLIELLIVMVVMGVLAGLAILKSNDLRNTAIATHVSQEMRAVQIAAFNYYAGKEAWPAEVGPGAVPEGLGPLLPGQLSTSFDREAYLLDYDNFGGEDGRIIAVAAITDNPKLMAKLVSYLGNKAPAFFVMGNKVTFIISGPGGGF